MPTASRRTGCKQVFGVVGHDVSLEPATDNMGDLLVDSGTRLSGRRPLGCAAAWYSWAVS